MDFRFGRFEIRPAQRQLLVDGSPVKLGGRAFDVLQALVERRDRTVSKNELLDVVWPGLFVEENNLEVQVVALRKLLGPTAIATIPGRGYRLTAAPLEGADGATNVDARSSPRFGRAQAFDEATSPLFGRDDDLAALGALLPQCRLITVTGSGGVGKSRLAQRLAFEQCRSFRGGVFWIELAAISEPALVLGTIATALRTSLRRGDSYKQLTAAVGSLDILLVLDNAEHVAGEVARIVQALLEDADSVRILVTSQVSLRVPNERVYRLNALAVPEPTSELDEALSYGAVALFANRARAADRLFMFSDQNVAACISICRQLDGVPLAIELAAARVRLLGVTKLAGALDERLRLLNTASPIVPSRQQTLRAALEWSYGLLTKEEQLVLRRLGVFVDGFSLELAQSTVSDERIDQWMVLDLLGQLIDKSLVVTNEADIPRYRLLETTRAFALEKLNEAGETHTLFRRRAEALLAYLSSFSFWSQSGPDFPNAGAELESLRAALDWTLSAAGDRGLAYALLGVSRTTWHARGQLFEGIERCKQVYPIPEELPRDVQARMLHAHAGLGYLTCRADCFEAAERAAKLFRELGDPYSLADTLILVALIGSRRGEERKVAAAIQEAEGLYAAAWSLRKHAHLALAQAQWHAMCGREEEAFAASLQQVAFYQKDNDHFRVQVGQSNAAIWEARIGHYESAIDRLQTALSELRRLRAAYGFGQTLGYLAFAYAMRNAESDLNRAQTYAREAWPHLRTERGVYWLLPAMAFSLARNGCAESAALLLGHADALWSREGFVPRPGDVRIRDETLEVLRRALGDERVEVLTLEGGALDDERGVALALESK